ncbi:hypothetical protein QTO34_012070 [Cnephaeus nilssonii]|uniref:Uncharacterized protein n=1 Tax=Cnephaeus nilssonii TaxID=3371016 RepID=A0AA40HCT5_CNENI|nr:hypothetical protein QTO34_012070 [Eptesicus nilssonii]
MDKLVLLLLPLLLLGGFPFMFFQGVAPATLCRVCKIFKRGKCLGRQRHLHCGGRPRMQNPGSLLYPRESRDQAWCGWGRSSCLSSKHGPLALSGIPSLADRWRYNHTQLDCSSECKAWKLFRGDLKVSIFCCQGQDFCNMYRGKSLFWKSH